MSWFKDAVTSSVGRKIIVALTALFLIVFLVVHVAGNTQLFLDDGGEAFNLYSHFMSHNELIKIVEWLLFASIIIHIIGTVMLTSKNAKARPVKYKQSQANKNSSWFSRNMFLSGSIILIFLVVHFVNFYIPYHFQETGFPKVMIEGKEYGNMYLAVKVVFQEFWWYSILYIVSMILLAFHLNHGFQSAFQSLGINHKKYTPFLKGLGAAFSVIVPLLFAAMPIYFLVLKFMN